MAFVRLENIVSAEDVARKWGMDSWTLGEITRKDRIYVYRLKDTRQLLDGKKVYLCDGPYTQGMPYEEDFRTRKYDLSLYVFEFLDIEGYELAHPEYLLPRACENDKHKMRDDKFVSAEAQEQVESLRQWNKRLTEQNQELRAELTQKAATNGANIWSYVTRRDELQIKNKDARITELETKLAEAQDIINQYNASKSFDFNDALKQDAPEAIIALVDVGDTDTALEYIRKKDARIAELEEELAAATAKPPMLTRTQAATETRQDKTLNTWQAAFKIMVPVILQCHADGPKKRTKTELQSICSRHGGELTAAQLEFLRGCLPDEHVNREGGATLQS